MTVHWRNRVPAWAYTFAVVLVVAGVALLLVRPWNRGPDPDPREYPEAGPVRVTVGGGNLERDLLPRYHVSLPCEVKDLRYGDSEDFGPAGELYLTFTTSSQCVDPFLTANGLTRDPALAHLLQVPDQYGWTFADDDDWYSGTPDPSNRLTAVVDLNGPDPTVYVVADHS